MLGGRKQGQVWGQRGARQGLKSGDTTNPRKLKVRAEGVGVKLT